MIQRKIAIVCQYELTPNRIGGMDYFFWAFQKECNKLGVLVHWYFPNRADFGTYRDFKIISDENIENKIIEDSKNGEVYDVIITHFIELCTSFFKELKKYSNAKIIAVDHNPRPLNGYSLKKRLKKKVKGFLYSNYIDLFVGVSNYTKDEIIKDFGNQILEKTIVVYNGVVHNEIVKRVTFDNFEPRFIVVSHLRQSKGIQDLIKAVWLLPEGIRENLKIDVFGDGPYKENLISLCNELKVQNNFQFKGSSGEIKSILYKYDYLLHPTHMECFSLTLLESLAANVPVVTTPVGGNLEVITHGLNGFVFKVKDSNTLSLIIKKIITRELVIKQNTSLLVEQEFSIDKMVQNYISLL